MPTNQSAAFESQGNVIAESSPGQLAAAGTWILRAYLLQLAFPLLLLVDCVYAMERGTVEASDKMIAVAAALWLAAGIGALLVSRDRETFLRRILGPIICIYTVLFCLAGIELFVRVLVSKPIPVVWRPGSRYLFSPDTKDLPGVSTVVHFTANELGLRGPSVPNSTPVYRVIAIGGSTTLCLMLDDRKTWPDRLMQEMNGRQQRLPVWVANAGVNGHTAMHHLAMLRDLQAVREADLYIFLPGINDLQYALAFHGSSTDNFVAGEVAQFERHMESGANNPYPYFRRLKIYQLFRKSADKLFERTSGIHRNEALNEVALRKQRAQGAITTMPSLSVGIAEYQARIRRLGQACADLRVRCLLMTQPSMYRDGLSAQEQGLFLFGWLGSKGHPDAYVTVSDLDAAMASYNLALLSVCKEENLECLDLASLVPKNASVFYDDVHLNEGGAAIVARSIADWLLTQRPFRQLGN